MTTTRPAGEPQSVPVKLFKTPDRLTIAAPMPGVLPEDIVVEVGTDARLTLHGERREGRDADEQLGLRSGEPKETLLNEWVAGGYHRELTLGTEVDGELATLTFGNGVLVVALPIAEQTRPARLTLERIGPGRGERVGSAGHPIQPMHTEEHWAAKETVWKTHSGAAPSGLDR